MEKKLFYNEDLQSKQINNECIVKVKYIFYNFIVQMQLPTILADRPLIEQIL